MRVLYWGTPSYAVPGLEALANAGHELVGVVSQPDRRRGRGGDLMPSPVKARALALGLPVLTPERIRREPELHQQLADLRPDLSVVVAFGQILPPAVLVQPPLGCWNGHGSLLPRWRGAAPIQWALLEGDAETGVGIMAMEEGLDTGPVLLERHLAIDLRENALQLGERLSQLTAELLIEALPRIEAAGPGPELERWRRLGLRPQNLEGMTYARMLKREDSRVNWQGSALAIHRTVMGLYPGAFTTLGGRRLKLLATEPLVERLADQLSPEAAELVGRWSSGAAAGTVLEIVEDVGLVVATGGCPLLLRQGQLEGKSAAEAGRLIQQLGTAAGEILA